MSELSEIHSHSEAFRNEISHFPVNNTKEKHDSECAFYITDLYMHTMKLYMFIKETSS